MADHEFWRDWKNKTKQEEESIISLKKVMKRIFNEIPKEQIIALYAKGSFVRREMNENSDVDLTMILKEGSYLPKLKVLKEKYETTSKPKISTSGYSLWELKTGKLSKQKWEGRMGPGRVVRQLAHYKLIYGKKLNSQKLFQISDKALLERTVKTLMGFLSRNMNKKDGFFRTSKMYFLVG